MIENGKYRMLHWSVEEARIKSFGASNRGKATTIKIEMEVTDPTRLGMIMSELQEASRPYRKTPAPEAPRPRALPAPRRALPSPALLLEDRRGK